MILCRVFGILVEQYVEFFSEFRSNVISEMITLGSIGRIYVIPPVNHART